MLHRNLPNRAQPGYAERFARATGGPAARGPGEPTQTGIPGALARSVGQGAVGFVLLGEGPRGKKKQAPKLASEEEPFALRCSQC